MVDVMSPAARSRLMGRIRSRNTGPEVRVRSLLHRLGFRFRLHGKGLPGKPDVVLKRWRTCLFVHGCFWHRHADPHCPIARGEPASHREFWRAKFARNLARDRRDQAALVAQGWRVVVVWECELRNPAALAARLADLRAPGDAALVAAGGLAAAEPVAVYGGGQAEKGMAPPVLPGAARGLKPSRPA